MAVIDFHTHILPGIDDGSRSLESTDEMCSMSLAQGVEVMVATPHFYPWRDRVEDFLDRRHTAWEQWQTLPREKRPDLLLGAEVAFFRGISQAEQIEKMTIQGTNVLLLEMPFQPWSEKDMEELERLSRQYHVLLAHLERYLKLPGNKQMIKEALEMQLSVQINADSLLDWKQRGTLIRMFRKGQAHFLGSDCHGVHHRVPNLQAGRSVLEKKLGAGFLAECDAAGTELLIRT